MTLLITVVVVVLGLQILIFIMTRRKIKREKENSVVAKYNIESSGDAWKLINDLDIPEEDRHKIEEIYKGRD